MLIQRVTGAQTEADSKVLGRIERGLLLCVGVSKTDTTAHADWLASRIPLLRIFEDERGKLSLNASQVCASILAIPNWTLCADTSQGRRPDFSAAAERRDAECIFLYFMDKLRQSGLVVRAGTLGRHAHILNIVDGPMNLVLDCPGPTSKLPRGGGMSALAETCQPSHLTHGGGSPII